MDVFNIRPAGLPVSSEPWSGRGATSEPSTNSARDLVPSQTRSANRISSQPTDSTVLSSIISSLDTLAPFPGVQSPEHVSNSVDRRSRPHSPSDGGTVASGASPRLPSTTGFGVEYGNSLNSKDDAEEEDGEGVVDAALPPTIRTARLPSGLSQYAAPRTPAYASDSTNAPLRLVPDSPRNSFNNSPTDRQANTRNKLSAESWVRKNSAIEDTGEMSRGRSNTKNSHQAGSQEVASQGNASPSPTRKVDAFVNSRSGQVSTNRPTTASSSRGRLYLRDSTINEDWPLANPLATSSPPAVLQREAETTSRSSPEHYAVPALVTPSPASNPISDSIPTRTSSLSVSPAPSKRNKKKRRESPASGSKQKEPKPYKPSKQIPESKWADLGEDDETVKRIRQLKEQRKTRLQSLGNIDSSSTDLSVSPTREEQDPPSPSALYVGRYGSLSGPVGVAQSSSTDLATSRNGPDRRPSLASGTSSPIKQSFEVKTPPLPPTASFKPLKPSGLGSPKQSLDSSVSGSRYNGRGDAVRTPSREDLERSLSQKTRASQHSSPPPVPSFQKRPMSKKYRKSTSEKHSELTDFERRRSRRRSTNDPRYRVWEDGIEQARRDSIDAAVLGYLDAPRLTQTVKDSVSGRVITFSEVGDPEGAAVFVCVGMGLTRFITAFYDELAATLRLRLITIDRPGVGGSEPYPSTDRSGPLSWPGDVLIICNELGITRFSLLAHSAGAVYALAAALILPHMINGKVHLLAPWIPPSQLEVISHPTASTPPAGALPRSQRILRALPTPLLKAANIGGSSASLRPPSKRKVANQRPVPQFGVEPEAGEQEKLPPADERPEFARRESMMLMDQYMPETNPSDNFPIGIKEDDDIEPALRRGSLVLSATATPTDPSFTYASKALNAAEHTARERHTEYTSRLTESTWTLATRDSHPTVDLVVCLERNRDVGFRYTDVERDVVIHAGAEDKRVPIRNVKWIAEQMNRRADYRNTAAAHNPPESRDSWADAETKGSCEVRVLTGEGHGLMANPTIMSDVLTEITTYWVGQQDRGRIM